jgi:hypothetical protein
VRLLPKLEVRTTLGYNIFIKVAVKGRVVFAANFKAAVVLVNNARRSEGYFLLTGFPEI